MGSTSSLRQMVKKVSKGSAPKVEFPKNAVEAKKRTFSIGGNILPPKRNLTRFVKWPKYIRLQRAKMTLLKRIKIPPAINQFQQTLDKRQASQLFRLLNNLKPETRAAKKERMAGQAGKEAAGEKSAAKKPVCVKMGINHVTTLVEEKKAKLVIRLPQLCKLRNVPYCIVKSKARLGAVVGKKTATCLAITDVKAESKKDLENVVSMAMANFDDVFEDSMRKWGDAQPSNRQIAHLASLARKKE